MIYFSKDSCTLNLKSNNIEANLIDTKRLDFYIFGMNCRKLCTNDVIEAAAILYKEQPTPSEKASFWKGFLSINTPTSCIKKDH